jgi:hypothetical protein
MRALLALTRHEGWSYAVNLFDPNTIANDPTDLWSANCAIPELLFENKNQFESSFSTLSIIRNEKVEFLLFPLSGGVISRTRMPELPFFVLSAIKIIDQIAVRLLPNLFAFGRRVVIQKR